MKDQQIIGAIRTSGIRFGFGTAVRVIKRRHGFRHLRRGLRHRLELRIQQRRFLQGRLIRLKTGAVHVLGVRILVHFDPGRGRWRVLTQGTQPTFRHDGRQIGQRTLSRLRGFGGEIGIRCHTGSIGASEVSGFEQHRNAVVRMVGGIGRILSVRIRRIDGDHPSAPVGEFSGQPIVVIHVIRQKPRLNLHAQRVAATPPSHKQAVQHNQPDQCPAANDDPLFHVHLNILI